MSGSTSSRKSTPTVRKWKEIQKKKIDVSKKQVEKEKIKVEPSPLHDYIAMPKVDEVDSTDNLKSKVCNWVLGSSLHNMFQTNVQGPKWSWEPIFF